MGCWNDLAFRGCRVLLSPSCTRPLKIFNCAIGCPTRKLIEVLGGREMVEELDLGSNRSWVNLQDSKESNGD